MDETTRKLLIDDINDLINQPTHLRFDEEVEEKIKSRMKNYMIDMIVRKVKVHVSDISLRDYVLHRYDVLKQAIDIGVIVDATITGAYTDESGYHRINETIVSSPQVGKIQINATIKP